jgi:hypothetical protein
MGFAGTIDEVGKTTRALCRNARAARTSARALGASGFYTMEADVCGSFTTLDFSGD